MIDMLGLMGDLMIFEKFTGGGNCAAAIGRAASRATRDDALGITWERNSVSHAAMYDWVKLLCSPYRILKKKQEEMTR